MNFIPRPRTRRASGRSGRRLLPCLGNGNTRFFQNTGTAVAPASAASIDNPVELMAFEIE